MSKPILAVFDLDGTLLNTLGDLSAAANYSMRKGGFPEHELQEYQMMIGHGIRNLIKNALPEGVSDDVLSERLADFTGYYAEHIDIATVPYEGITQMLENLKNRGVKMAVASNKFLQGTQILVKKFFPDIEWVDVCGNSPDIPLKPDPAVIERIMQKAGTDREHTLMIGDAGSDIQTARNASVKAVAVSWGFRPLEDLAGADVLVNNAQSLQDVILTL